MARRPTDSLSIAHARRIALAAQGFATPRPAGVSDRRQVRRVLQHTQLFQIDSVNVLARAHEMPLWSRIGAYRRGILDTMTAEAELFEFWAHEASLLPAADWPLVQWRMAAARSGEGWRSVVEMQRRQPTLVADVLARVVADGPIAASSFNEPGRRTGPWWDWSDAKLALEYLFWTGQVTARRRSNFEREYDLPHRVLPAAIVDAPAVPEPDARRIMVERSARALGVATDRDLFDYYRLKPKDSRVALQELVEAGTVRPVEVEGWNRLAYLHCDATLPRSIKASTVLSPFDPVVWERDRTLRLFDFHYRIEIYTPAAKRVHGYYVLPFLLGDRLAARVDLKADRKTSTLLVPGAFTEPHTDLDATSAALATELRALADWLGLETITVGRRGDLQRALRDQLRSVH